MPSLIPESKITESIILFFLGWPNGLHSGPQEVYITVFPSDAFKAMVLASVSKSWNNARSRYKVVKVTVSKGVPLVMSSSFPDLSRLISMYAPLYLIRCFPGPGTNENVVVLAPLSCWTKEVSTDKCLELLCLY
ncbi:hypothetical protein WICPIJ_001626 [Wickerhamomyces pijperi]|uniref:Uncharacterized protein n=1 Tax=Wickerhamomyces pijperi TaxID=599730 RepID=A0A9P8TQJ9_WICPI|nr:hypothetical protein WICPIJ_001626 [Wickerhamomyces pijperi]